MWTGPRNFHSRMKISAASMSTLPPYLSWFAFILLHFSRVFYYFRIIKYNQRRQTGLSSWILARAKQGQLAYFFCCESSRLYYFGSFLLRVISIFGSTRVSCAFRKYLIGLNISSGESFWLVLQIIESYFWPS